MLPLLYLWNSKALFIGRSLETTSHKHHAVQIFIGLKRNVEIRANDRTYKSRGIFVPADLVHKVTFMSPVASMLVDAESELCKLFLAQFNLNNSKDVIPFNPSYELIEDLEKIQSAPTSSEQVERLFYKVLNLSVRHPDPIDPATDGRISKCIEHIHGHLEEPLKASHLAEICNLSEGRLIHLFREIVGVPIRRYILWSRVKQAVIQHIANGQTLTLASHSAGFADQAHFSRAFKDIFGVTPTFIFNSKLRLMHKFSRLRFCDDA